MRTNNLLVELLVEELPPKALKMLGASFSDLIVESLKSQGLLSNDSSATSFASPRRLATHITAVIDKAADKAVQQKLMPVNVGLDKNEQPTPALLKRLSALGLDATSVANLKRAPDGKTEALFIDVTVSGATITMGIQKSLDEMLAKLPIPKVMSYQLADGWSSVNFVRPAHGLVVLHGAEVLDVSVLGLQSGRISKGHRFEAMTTNIEFRDADSYATQLESEGSVVAHFGARRAEIAKQLEVAAAKVGLKPVEDDALLDEVTALVERPNVLNCRFEKEFLDVPQECLILTMKANQKYFPLLDATGRLSNQFLVVSNIRPSNPSRVIEGNERVVRPRLADAKFFYEQDRKYSLESRRERLKQIVYHNKLGSIWDRSERVSMLSRRLDLDGHLNERDFDNKVKEAAELAKTDLVTNMVGEFPELQGVMGRYYALADGVDAEVAEALREQYLPRGAGDELPLTKTGMALALADKIDTIVGVFAIDQKPTGAKDPFGVRRAAIGVLRILIERALPMDLFALIEQSMKLQPVQTKDSVTVDAYDYVMERLRGYYLEGNAKLAVTTEMFDAVLAVGRTSPLDFDRRLRALSSFLKLTDAQSLASANKRIGNILRKSGQETFGDINTELLHDPLEQVLAEQVLAMGKVTEPLFAARDYAQALSRLAGLRPAVDAFFDGVMVMADDIKVRNNRLALLARLRELFGRVADLSRLPG